MIHYLERLQKQMAANWNGLALCDYNGDSFTFGDTAREIAKLHILFSSLGLKKGDRIAICARNQARWGVSFLAANTYEAVVVPLLADFTPDSIHNLINHSGSVLLFTDEAILRKLDRKAMPGLRVAVSMSTFEPLWLDGPENDVFAGLDDAFFTMYPNGFGINDVNYPTDNGKDLAVINYTSGSTGDPKGVMLRYECFSANTEYGQNMQPSYPTDNLLSVLPMAHIFGMSFDMIYPLCGGTTVYFLGKAPAPSLLMKALADIKPYHLCAVPMVYEKIYTGKIKPMLEKPAMKVLTRIPGIRALIYRKIRSGIDATFGGKMQEYIMGGAAMNPEVEDFFRKIGLHFTVGYGMTEAAPLLAYSTWDTFKLRSCGRAMDFVTLRIDSEDPENVPGEIQAKGVSLFSGYYRNEEATREAFTEDGWFNTGDLGVMDKEGNVFIRGRRKNLLLSSNGQNIYPEEVEPIVNSQPYVQECVVVQRGDKLVALVYLNPDEVEKGGFGPEMKDKLRTVIMNNSNSRLPKYSQIAKVEYVDEPFIKTPKMSIKRYLYK